MDSNHSNFCDHEPRVCPRQGTATLFHDDCEFHILKICFEIFDASTVRDLHDRLGVEKSAECRVKGASSCCGGRNHERLDCEHLSVKLLRPLLPGIIKKASSVFQGVKAAGHKAGDKMTAADAKEVRAHAFREAAIQAIVEQFKDTWKFLAVENSQRGALRADPRKGRDFLDVEEIGRFANFGCVVTRSEASQGVLEDLELADARCLFQKSRNFLNRSDESWFVNGQEETSNTSSGDRYPAIQSTSRSIQFLASELNRRLHSDCFPYCAFLQDSSNFQVGVIRPGRGICEQRDSGVESNEDSGVAVTVILVIGDASFSVEPRPDGAEQVNQLSGTSMILVSSRHFQYSLKPIGKDKIFYIAQYLQGPLKKSS